MKPILMMVFLFPHATDERLDFQGENCVKYLKKFFNVNNSFGTGATKLSFAGEVPLSQNDINIKIRYSDVDLFNDPKYFGLVQEDGKAAETTCLDLKLWQYNSNTYSDPVQVTDLPITNSSYSPNQWRYYLFTIPKEQFGTRLVLTTTSANFIYQGYYAIAFYIADANYDRPYYFFYFEFSVTVDKASGTTYDTYFKSLSYSSTLQCRVEHSCYEIDDTQVRFCQDLTCQSYVTPDLHYLDQFVLQQVVTTYEMDYYLVLTEVWYIATGLNKKATIISINNSKKGQAIIQLRVDIVWSTEVTIRVASTLSTSQIDTEIYDTVNGQTLEMQCIKAEGEEKCPSELGSNYFEDEENSQGNLYLISGAIFILFLFCCCIPMCCYATGSCAIIVRSCVF